ncbi:MAG: type II toxin-antitoxin system HicB family antitoxin [Actinomycetia bacterium]|nr:type II toxin-antitoxin system HicB family antitoxin [Actinomycetes bacterium]
MMEYKGYVAAVEYDNSVELLHGEVVNAGPYPVVTFEAADVEGLKREFRASIDDYLAWCEEEGVEPQRPFSGKLNLRLGAELHRRVAASAAQQKVSINTWIKSVLEEQATL